MIILSPENRYPTSGPTFYATLRPNKSLTFKELALVLIGFSSICVFISIIFLISGAWPVLGFLGLDILILYLAFRAHDRSTKKYERLSLSPNLLLIERITCHGHKSHWSFQPHWLSVVLECDHNAGQKLSIQSKGRKLEIGCFLNVDEKFELAEALQIKLTCLKSYK